MAGKALWGSVACAVLSVLSAAAGIAVLARDEAKEHRFAKLWFILHMITAGLAATYYSKVVHWQRTAQLRLYHDNFLWLCRVLGVPVMAAHITESALGLKHASDVLTGVGVGVFALGCWSLRHRQLLTAVANCVVLAVLTVLCCLHRTALGLVWVAVLAACLVVGTHGAPLVVGRGLLVARIDLTHLLLVACNAALVGATV